MSKKFEKIDLKKILLNRKNSISSRPHNIQTWTRTKLFLNDLYLLYLGFAIFFISAFYRHKMKFFHSIRCAHLFVPLPVSYSLSLSVSLFLYLLFSLSLIIYLILLSIFFPFNSCSSDLITRASIALLIAILVWP